MSAAYSRESYVASYLILQNLDGKLILHQNYKGENVSDIMKLLSSGLYIFEYLDASLRVIDRQKMAVVN
jgi:hypothetical protein